MQNVHQSPSNGQSPAGDFADLIADLEQRFASLNGPTIAAELAALRAIGEQLLVEAKAAASVNGTGLDLRTVSSAELRQALIVQRGPKSASNFATRLTKDLARLRGALRIATGGRLTVR
jgi:hypothetical protein